MSKADLRKVIESYVTEVVNSTEFLIKDELEKYKVENKNIKGSQNLKKKKKSSKDGRSDINNNIIKILEWIIDNPLYTALISNNNPLVANVGLHPTSPVNFSCLYMVNYIASIFSVKVSEPNKYVKDLYNNINLNRKILNKYPAFFLFEIINHEFSIITIDGSTYFYVDYFCETERLNPFGFSILTKKEFDDYINVLEKGDIKKFVSFNNGNDNFYNLYKDNQDHSLSERIKYYKIHHYPDSKDILRATITSENNYDIYMNDAFNDDLYKDNPEKIIKSYEGIVNIRKKLINMIETEFPEDYID